MMLKRKRICFGLSSCWARVGGTLLCAITAALALASACIDRPVAPQDPNTSNIYVAQLRQTAVDKIDLLFMIDNSSSMQDKQQILREAVPVLVQRLVTPICLDANGNPTGNATLAGRCELGEAEFTPIKDIHIAIVTSSLGGLGGDVCTSASGPVDPSNDDRALPLGLVRPNLQTSASYWANTGFLAWDPDAVDPARARNRPPGVATQEAFEAQFQNMVDAVGEVGCGYEASLEAWYRFLIDPHPTSEVRRSADGLLTETVYKDQNGEPTNQQLLALRRQFLRPDSLVAIILLTDENDCSIIDHSQGFLVGLQRNGPKAFRMPRSTSICGQDPNNECCLSCSAISKPANCPDPSLDVHCATPLYGEDQDHVNLRCHNQRARFGMDYLHPTDRYVRGLTERTVIGRDNKEYANPLFEGSRDESLVFLAGIIGVPWQDIATPESLSPNAPLKYMTFAELKKHNRFDWILGKNGGVPEDALMYETSVDRSTLGFLKQTHPATGEVIAKAGPGPRTHSIHGKESTILDGSDLQYACIFPLHPNAVKTNCRGGSCDCNPSDEKFNRALCDGNTQTHAKAYPGIRQLEVLKGFGEITQNAIVASICPKFTNPGAGTSYGYTPAVASIIERLKEVLRGKCLPRSLSPCTCDPVADPSCGQKPGDRICAKGLVPKQVPCVVIEATLPETGKSCAPCAGVNAPLLGRANPQAEIEAAVHNQLRKNRYCENPERPGSCHEFCLCEIQQFEGDALKRCQSEVTKTNDSYGYCYVDPLSPGLTEAEIQASSSLVSSCPNTQRRLLRFTGENVPAKGAIALIACLGSDVQQLPSPVF